MIALGRLWGWETEVADWRPCPMTTLIILSILNTHVKLYGRYSHGLYQDTISKSFSTVTEENNVHPHSILIPTRNLSDTKRRYFNFYSCSNWKMYILIEVILWTADGLICWRDFVLLQNQSVHKSRLQHQQLWRSDLFLKRTKEFLILRSVNLALLWI